MVNEKIKLRTIWAIDELTRVRRHPFLQELRDKYIYKDISNDEWKRDKEIIRDWARWYYFSKGK